MPLTNYTFDQLLDFTRTTSGTFVGSNGLIQTTPASVNLLTWTQQFDNAAWAKTGTTVTANTTVAPDGTSTADTLTEDSANTSHFITGPSAAFTSGVPYTYSVLAKFNGRFLRMFLPLSAFPTANRSATFNLQTGAVTADSGVIATATDAGNGYYRCSITVVANATASGGSGLSLSSTFATGLQTYAGDGASGVFVWGAQVEVVPDANLVLGSELITNPGPFSATTGWTAAVGSISTSSGSLVITVGAGGSARAVSSAMSGLTIGAAYRINVSGVAGDASAKNIRITTNADGSTGALFTQAISGTSITYYFVATATTHYLALTAGSVLNQTFSLSQASVKQITGTVGMPSTYTRNNGGVYPPRFDYDPATLAPKGILIEEQRTNLLLNSVFSGAVSGTPGTAPTSWTYGSTGGTLTVTDLGRNFACNSLRFAATAGRLYLVQTVTVAATGTYVLSANINVFTTAQLIQLFQFNPGPAGATYQYVYNGVNQASSFTPPLGAGLLQVIITTTGTGGALGIRVGVGASSAITGDVSFQDIQIELGAFATSYIPTGASTVTRATDTCAIVAPNFAPWYNASEGTLVVSGDWFGISGNDYFAAIDDASVNNALGLNVFPGSSDNFAVVRSGGTQVASMALGALTANTVYNMALAYKLNDFAASRNGGTVVTDTLGAVPVAPTRLAIGDGFAAAGNTLNGHIRSIRYYPVRLSDTQLQALTA